MPSWRKCFSAILFAFFVFTMSAPVASQSPAPERPKLIVVVVIDQFRADYLVRFKDKLGPDGFNRLMREGAYFPDCYYPYAITETGPGHATLATGTTPDRHGIAGNTWYDARRKRVVEAVEDDMWGIVGSPSTQQGASPRNLMSTTWADELRLATGGEAKVFGVALKDRAAMFSTGQTASGAYWYDTSTGRFVTSKYYADALPAWTAAFNDRKPADRYYGQSWKIGDRVALDLTTPEGTPGPAYYRNLRFTPMANDLTVEFARALIENEKLGEGGTTDVLFVGLSANDYVGHRWGPYSDEVTQVTLQTDRVLAGFLSYLDQRIGKGSYWFVLSGDHGVAPTLVQARARNLTAKSISVQAVMETSQKALTSRWGPGEWFIPRSEGTFNRDTLAKYSVSVADAARVAGEAALAVDGVGGYVAADSAQAPESIVWAYRLSYYPGRSADLFLVQEPFSLRDGDRGGTTHGTPYSYDTNVPLILSGPVFRTGLFREEVSTIDLAPTMAAALGITRPSLATGRILTQALAPLVQVPVGARKQK